MNRTLMAALVAANFGALALGGFARSAQPTSQPEVIFERTLSVDRSANIFTTDDFRLDISLGDSFFTPTNPLSVFAGLHVSPADAGRVFDLSATSPSAFADAVSRLTDARNEYVQLTLTEQASGRSERRGWRERGFFMGAATAETPDLAGADVEEIRLRIDSFHLAASGSAAAPPVQLLMTFTVLGVEAVPEPSAAKTALIGLAMLAAAPYTIGRVRRPATVAVLSRRCK